MALLTEEVISTDELKNSGSTENQAAQFYPEIAKSTESQKPNNALADTEDEDDDDEELDEQEEEDELDEDEEENDDADDDDELEDEEEEDDDEVLDPKGASIK